MGRPASKDRKAKRLNIRVSQEEKDFLYLKAAEEGGDNLADYCRGKLGLPKVHKGLPE